MGEERDAPPRGKPVYAVYWLGLSVLVIGLD